MNFFRHREGKCSILKLHGNISLLESLLPCHGCFSIYLLHMRQSCKMMRQLIRGKSQKLSWLLIMTDKVIHQLQTNLLVGNPSYHEHTQEKKREEKKRLIATFVYLLKFCHGQEQLSLSLLEKKPLLLHVKYHIYISPQWHEKPLTLVSISCSECNPFETEDKHSSNSN